MATTRAGRGRPTTKTRGNLRAVPTGTKATTPRKRAAAKPKTVAEAAKGSQLELLEALRARVAKTIDSDSCPPRDLAALTRRLQEITREIAALKLAAEQEAKEKDAPPDEALDAASL